MVDKAVQIILAITPVVYFRAITQNTFDMMVFHICAVVLFMASLFDSPAREFGYAKESAALFAVCLVNVFLHRFDMYVMNATLNLFVGFVCVYIMVRYIRSLDKIRKAIAIAALVNIAVYAVQRLGYNPFMPSSREGYVGAFLNNNCRFATYIATVLPVCMGLGVVAHKVVIFSSLILVSWWSKQQAILGPAIAYLFAKAKYVDLKVFVLICSAAAVFIPFLSTFHSSSHVGVRVDTWKNVITGFLNNPVAGYGLGVFPWGPDRVPVNTDAVVYSSLLQFITGLGILSLAWLVWCLRRVFKFDGSIEAVSVICLGVLCLYEYPFEIPKLWMTLVAIISMFLIRMQSNKEGINAG